VGACVGGGVVRNVVARGERVLRTGAVILKPGSNADPFPSCNGGINDYFTSEHGLLQEELSIITSKMGNWVRESWK
jgi:hypothetical protein